MMDAVASNGRLRSIVHCYRARTRVRLEREHPGPNVRILEKIRRAIVVPQYFVIKYTKFSSLILLSIGSTAKLTPQDPTDNAPGAPESDSTAGSIRRRGVRPSSKRTKDLIPDIVIGRLPVYLRTLNMLAEEGMDVTSSQELGERLGISSAQIRKDLSHFGEFGKQGTGYHVHYLIRQLEKILHVDRIWPVILVGAGSLGRAIANYEGFESRGFRIAAIFDKDPQKIGQEVGHLIIEDADYVAERIAQLKARIAIIAVPASVAQSVADSLIRAGISSILCYAPITLQVPENVRVEYIDPLIHLQHMAYYLTPDDASEGQESEAAD